MKNQDEVFEAKPHVPEKEDHTVKIILAIVGVILLIVAICLIARSSNGKVISIGEVISKLES